MKKLFPDIKKTFLSFTEPHRLTSKRIDRIALAFVPILYSQQLVATRNEDGTYAVERHSGMSYLHADGKREKKDPVIQSIDRSLTLAEVRDNFSEFKRNNYGSPRSSEQRQKARKGIILAP